MSRYEARLNLHGATQRERTASRLRQSITSKVQGSLSYKDVLLNDIETALVIDSNNTYPHIKEIKSLPSEKFEVGDYVYWSNVHWIIIKADRDNEIYVDGAMQECNWMLKFQVDSGEILSYPCIDENSTQYNSGEKDGKTVTLGAAQHMITLPCNDDTILLRDPLRLILDKHPTTPSVYKVTQNDTTTYNYGGKGLVKVTVTQGELNTKVDRVDLGVCDYFKPDENIPVDPDSDDEPIVKHIITSTLDRFDGKIKLGMSYTFKSYFVQGTDNIVEDSDAELIFSVDNTYDNMVQLTDNGDGSCIIKVNSSAYNLLAKKVVLECEDKNSGSLVSMMLDIVGLF